MAALHRVVNITLWSGNISYTQQPFLNQGLANVLDYYHLQPSVVQAPGEQQAS